MCKIHFQNILGYFLFYNMIKKPAVKNHILFLISAIIWSGVGLMLIVIASKWFPLLSGSQIVFALIAGLVLGAIISWFGFNKLARKNVKRILIYPKNVCVFAFQRWQMYPTVLVMMSLGIFMRTSSFIPKYLLIPFYIGLGLALFNSSFVYYKIFLKEFRDS
jgi:hypothetical protein